MRSHPVPAALLVALALCAACGGPPPVTPQSPLDTAPMHYERGRVALDEGDLRTASFEFERARALDPDYPGNHVGAALLAAAQGSYFEARQEIERALHGDAKFVDAHVALGRIVAAEGLAKGRDTGAWLTESRRAFAQAARLAPDDPRPDYERARVEAQAGELDAALAAYGRVAARNRGPLVAPAMAAIERIQTVQRTAPGTRIGARIALRDSLTRAELTVLLVEELHLEALVAQHRRLGGAAATTPVADSALARSRQQSADELRWSWAAPWIERVHELGIPGLEPLPDGSFHPEQTVTRADFARVIEGVLVLLSAAPDLATRYVGEPSRFPDVRADHFAYNAIALSVDRGIMHPEAVSGRFRPQAPVSGAEALATIRSLQNAVRMEF